MRRPFTAKFSAAKARSLKPVELTSQALRALRRKRRLRVTIRLLTVDRAGRKARRGSRAVLSRQRGRAAQP